MIEYVYNISREKYLEPIAYFQNMANMIDPDLDTNLVKYADEECTVILERYYPDMKYFKSSRITVPIENKYIIPDPILEILSKNDHLISRGTLYGSFYSVNEGEDFINAYYLSYDMYKDEKLIGVEYEIDENLKEIAYQFEIQFDKNGKFLCVGYAIDDTACSGNEWQMKEALFPKLMNFSKNERERIEEIVNARDTCGIEIIRKQNKDVIIYVSYDEV